MSDPHAQTPDPPPADRPPGDEGAGSSRPVPLGIRLFLIPFLIVAACGLVLLISRMLSTDQPTAWELVQDVRTAAGNRRWQAAYELSMLIDRQGPPADPRVGAELIRLFENSDDARVRQYVALSLGKIGERRAVGPLSASLAGTDADTRLYTVWALGALGDTTAVGSLARLVRDADPGVRTALAYALGNLGTPRGRALLEDLLEDSHAEVRWNAATGLARLGSGAGLAVLRRMIDRESLSASGTIDPRRIDEIMVNGIRAIALLDGERLEAELDALRRSDASPAVRRAAADALAERRAREGD